MSKNSVVETFLGENLGVFCDENYGKQYGELFRGNLPTDLEEILSTCKHHKDNRTLLKYGQDLILGWILEDFIRIKLEEDNNIKVKKMGADAERVFLANKYVSSDADLKVNISGTKDIIVEVIADYGGFWKRTGTAHLRDNKILKLLRNKEDTYLLAIDVLNLEFQYIYISNSNNIKHIESHIAFGGKPAYEISIDESKFIEIDKLSDVTIRL